MSASMNKRIVVGVAVLVGAMLANLPPSIAQSWQPPPAPASALPPPQTYQLQSAQSQASLLPRPYVEYPLMLALGSHGFFEVTPSGSLVFYPVWTSVEPAVMHTILAMMGPTSLVGRRGLYDVTRDGQVRFFLPPAPVLFPQQRP
jgi:hypothetical protein